MCTQITESCQHEPSWLSSTSRDSGSGIVARTHKAGERKLTSPLLGSHQPLNEREVKPTNKRSKIVQGLLYALFVVFAIVFVLAVLLDIFAMCNGQEPFLTGCFCGWYCGGGSGSSKSKKAQSNN